MSTLAAEMMDSRQAERYRFGVFEADAATGELRKQGIRLRVNVQPFQVLLMLLRRMHRGDLTAHGFCSTFRDWCAEQTAFSREVAESALAHVTGDKTELAYRRGDLFEKRRRLMDAWAVYCAKPSVKNTGGNVSKMARRN